MADEVEQELATGLGEWQIAEFVEDDEVHAREVIGKTAPARPLRVAQLLPPSCRSPRTSTRRKDGRVRPSNHRE